MPRLTLSRRTCLAGTTAFSFAAPAVLRAQSAPAGRWSVRFAWSGDTAGQGWGV